jgi:RimK family alpha-L-glutamate ligase
MKITLIAKNINYCNQNLIDASNKNNVEIEIIDFSNVYDFINYNNWGDVIIWRSSNLGTGSRYIIFEHLNNINKIIINIGQIEGNISSKYYQQYKIFSYIKQHGYLSLQYIPTFKFKSLEQLVNHDVLKLPIIEKPDCGAQGIGVRLIKNYNEINCLDNNIYQNYISNDCDYRIICVGNKVIGTIKRIAKKGDIRNNISQGGSVHIEADIQKRKQIESIALQVSNMFNLNLCGIDIIFDKKINKYKFLEINSLVWWKGFSETTGIDVGDEIIKHCIDLYNRKYIKTEELVQNYYDESFEHLDDKRFHYASRMYLFFKDNKYNLFLLNLQANYIGENQDQLDIIIKNILENNKNNSEFQNQNLIRNSVMQYYPNLSKYNVILFRFLFALKIYNKDISPDILKYIDIDTLTEYYQQLYSNHEHLCKLSTPAINYLYNVNFFLNYLKSDNIPELIPNYFLDIATKEYSNNIELKDQFGIQLYYYTHLIIGASRFYSEKIINHKDDYIKMIKICERIIQKNYFEINIDNKVEFLVCAKLLNYQTALFEIIYSECKNSLSDVGNYLIDRNNKLAKSNSKNNLIQSEHRNVLFIMAFRDRLNF